MPSNFVQLGEKHSARPGGGVLSYISYTGMCRPADGVVILKLLI